MKILLHSIRMVWNHMREALRISGVLYVILVVLAGIAATLTAAQGPYSGLAVFVWLATFIVAVWIAVGWHRYILLDEMPNSVLPKLFGKRMLVYVGYSALLWLIVAGIAFAGALALTPLRVLRPDTIELNALMTSVVSVGGTVLYALLIPAMIAAIIVIPYRLAPLLPGSAIGSGISIRAAWAATRGATWSIIILAIVSAIAAVAIDLPVYVLERLPMGVTLSLVWLVVTGWLKLMVAVTILTTIYGHYVEGRPIA